MRMEDLSANCGPHFCFAFAVLPVVVLVVVVVVQF